MSVGGKDKIKREGANSLARLKEKREQDANIRQEHATQEVQSLVKKLESIMGTDKLQLAVEPTLPIQIQTDGETGAFSDFAKFLDSGSPSLSEVEGISYMVDNKMQTNPTYNIFQNLIKTICQLVLKGKYKDVKFLYVFRYYKRFKFPNIYEAHYCRAQRVRMGERSDLMRTSCT